MTIAEATAAAPPRSDIAEVPVPTASAIDIAEAVAIASAIDIAEANDDDECTDTFFNFLTVHVNCSSPFGNDNEMEPSSETLQHQGRPCRTTRFVVIAFAIV